MSLPRSRIESDPDVIWIWEGEGLRGTTADGAVTVSIRRQSAQWSWNSYTLFSEKVKDQVRLTFDEIPLRERSSADRHPISEEVCPAWISLAASPARALASTATRERLSLSVNIRIPDRVFDVASEAIRLFEHGRNELR